MTRLAPAPSAPPALPAPASVVRARRRPAPSLVASLALIAFLLVAAVWPAILSTHSPTANDFAAALQSPSLAHWFGTDEAGRDLYSRVVWGARESLLIGAGAATVSLSLAIVLGTAGALGGRVLSGAVGFVLEVAFAFPALLLALLLVAILGPSAWTQVLAVGIGTAPGYARIVRGQVLAARTSGYVEAAVALGHPRWRIVLRQILPNALRPLVAIFALSVGQSIVWASSLAFLGLGVAPPSSEWGALLDAGRAYITRAPWLVVIPGLVIVALALAATSLGGHLRTALEKGDRS
ncbi:ABC transporter permease [Protaetiibacter sp. SSC-01]|uniref:ABC transporter permease n=1 Tax=Protaetiibacter sp. SSC-01 TaxID=2759943 RepID=UPI001CA3AA1C|nr:ABC transporter permease [Protaetiibacter sp. SSC-01]